MAETFTFDFTVNAPLEAVAEFHRDTRALRRLTPPPIFVQLHRVEPLAEGSAAEFTLWFGPLPIRWTAIHSAVDRERGFTDTQQRGLLKLWRHRHSFEAVGPRLTRVRERIEYEHEAGLRGLVSRVLFARPGLWLMFSYRRWVTRRALERRSASDAERAD